MIKLSDYGGRMIETDGQPTVEMIDPTNPNTRYIFQYRRTPNNTVERRVLSADDRQIMRDWQELGATELRLLYHVRGLYHPILDPLGL